MSLMQVLTRDNTFQSNTTPYAFFGSSYAGFPPSRTSITSSGSDVLAGSESEKQVRRSSDHKPGVEDSTKNTNMNNLQHVAQQSRREKLRIPGSLQQQPTSPHSEHSAPEIHETYTPNTNSDMLNSVYNNQMLTSELYSYTTGSELMNAVSGKAPGYMMSDSLPPAPGLLGYSGQSVLPPKGGGSGTWSGQLGQFSNISVNPPSSTGISATLLVNSGLPGAFGSTTGRDLGSYFTGANPQEAMQLYLMNAGFGGYPEGGGSMVFPNTQLPIQNPVSNSVSSPVGFSNRPGYSGWKGSDSELVFMPASERAKQYNGQEPDFSESFTANQQGLHVDAGAGSSQASGFQGLSLSLSSQQPPSLHALDVLHQSGLESPADGKRAKLTADLSHFRRDFSSGKIEAGANPSSTAMSASFNIISSSRYLKACQQLLEEVCSVGKGVKSEKGKKWSTPLTSPTSKELPIPAGAGNTTAKERSPESTKDGAGTNAATSTGTTSGGGTASGAGAATTASAAEGGESTSALSAEERQELESRKAKLVAMLQEVDRRYRQYYDQMQVVVSSFDAVAGVGAAMPYTALALQAMSRYFRCLKDAITGQISIVCKSLGEEDISKQITTKSPTSRLRFIDQQIRQQRAFQQLGMLNQHAWRPQRGLPERSVSILRAWLFEHFLHPYPKDADKMMLARQTGLTRSQVSNWFINARVRLWKPMVEEMYQEETREHELEAAANSRLHTDSEPGTGTEHPKHDTGSLNTQHTHMVAEYEASNNLGAASGSESNQFYEEASKKMRYDQGEHILSSMEMDMKHEDEHGLGGNPLSFPGGTYDGNLRFPTNPGFRYNVNPTGSSGVSLTLGLQHSENLQQAYLHPGFHHGLAQRDNQGEHGFAGLYENAGAGGLHEGMNYTSRKHMESQLMHDFVPS